MSSVYNPLGRQPLQKRGVERIDQILATTSDLIHELPLEEVNTNLIAKRAGLRVGTLYHFFPDKYAIYNALIHRALSQVDGVLAELLEAEPVPGPFEDVIDAIVMALDEFWQDENVLTTLWFTMQKHSETEQILQHFESMWIPAIAKRLAADIPQLSRERAELAAFMMLHTIYPLLDQSALLERPQAELFIREVSFGLRSYVSALRDMSPDQTSDLNEQATRLWPLREPSRDADE